MAQTLDFAATEGAICKLTKTCQDLFERCMQTDRLSTAEWLEKRQGMFNLWSFVLKASEAGKQSLDYRVRPRPDIAEFIKDLIEGLIEALEQCREIASTTDDEPDCHASHEQAGSSCPSEGSRDGQSPFWSEEEGDDDDGDGDWRDPFSQQKLYIISLVDQLRRISTAIRKSGTKYRYERADKEFNEDGFQELRSSMAIAIWRQQLWQPKAVASEAERNSTTADGSLSEASHHFPSEAGDDFHLKAKTEPQPEPQNHPQPGAGTEAPRGMQLDVQVLCRQLQDNRSLTPVQERLVRANILRHHRIIFFVESARKKAMLLAYRQRCEGQEPEKKKAKLIGASSHDQASASVAKLGDENAPTPPGSGKPVSQAEKPPPSQTGLSQVPTATAIAPGLDIKEVIRPKWSPSQLTVGTVTQDTQDYPRCPKALADGPAKGMIQCPYCAEILPGEYVKKDKRWRSHVANDLIPYMCVFEDCSTPDEMYASTFELTRHTIDAHGNPYWVCEHCPVGAADGVMESPWEWDAHMKREHPGGFREAELPLLRDASRQTLIPPVACPLCHTCQGLPSETLDEHIAKHLHAFALLSLPWGSTEGAESESDTNAAVRPTLGADRSPGQHKVLDKAAIHAWSNETGVPLPYICHDPNCTRTRGFKSKARLEFHIRSRHPNSHPSPCYKCHLGDCARGNKLWPREDNFRQHLRRKHHLNGTENIDEFIRDGPQAKPEPPGSTPVIQAPPPQPQPAQHQHQQRQMHHQQMQQQLTQRKRPRQYAREEARQIERAVPVLVQAQNNSSTAGRFKQEPDVPSPYDAYPPGPPLGPRGAPSRNKPSEPPQHQHQQQQHPLQQPSQPPPHGFGVGMGAWAMAAPSVLKPTLPAPSTSSFKPPPENATHQKTGEKRIPSDAMIAPNLKALGRGPEAYNKAKQYPPQAQHVSPAADSPETHHYGPPPAQQPPMGYQNQPTSYPPYGAAVPQLHSGSPMPQYAAQHGGPLMPPPSGIPMPVQLAWPTDEQQPQQAPPPPHHMGI
ncbi:hypothetical protein MAPG_06646 [Magnaporthiopsis poae ATCC 64411]|uniref:C2H2-type domain-containing protein n=1 Tax=Magnaporthiopsis poae (strain ATCC 64411 / 73-15) TaxID=644358 RepID=A0A0C4E2K5_MAGP6|nr:hypothetical protein MAPG_06646 [Magnaporthiopsis poae ATCC 64411]